MNEYPSLQDILNFLEEQNKQSNINTATGAGLTQLLTGSPRETYGDDYNNCPNDYCYWDELEGCWEENDCHYRERLYKALEE